MRGSKRRTDKYRKKIRGLVLPGQKARFTQAVKGQVKIEQAVKAILADHNVSANLIHFYMEFGKIVSKLMKKYKNLILYNEVEILQRIWGSRGLDTSILDLIKENLIPGWVSCGPFTLDVSLLDGCDYLV